MPTPVLQRGDAIPLYHQLFLSLRDEILSGRRPHGAALPTEHELADAAGVSRITARRALDELAAQGLAERRRRVGTRVSFRAPVAPIEANVDQAVEALIAFGRDTQVEVVALDEVPADPLVAEQLSLMPGAATQRALRRRLLDREPFGLIESHVPATLALALTRERLATTPLLELVRAAGHVIGGGRQVIAAVAADAALAERLKTEPRAALIRIERVVAGADGTPLLLTVAHYRGDRYRLSVDMHGFARPAA